MAKEGAAYSTPFRLEFLDGLRGLAAFVVVLYHSFCGFVPLINAESGVTTRRIIVAQDRFSLLINGTFCVSIFFVLSGFVLAQSAAKGRSSLPARLVARYFRLTVPMTVSMLMAWCLLHLFSGTRKAVAEFAPHSWDAVFSYTLSVPPLPAALEAGLYGVYLRGASPFNNVAWTMHYELLGSMAIYLFYRFCPASRRCLLLGLIAVVSCFAPTYLGFSLGALLREWWSQKWLPETRAAWWLIPVSAFLSVLPLRVASLNPLTFLFYSIGAALVLLSVLTLASLRLILSGRWPLFLGRISFALYLVHVPQINTWATWLYFHLKLPPYPRSLLITLAVVVVSITVAWVMTVGLDEPLMKRLHALKKLRFFPEAAGVT